MVSEAQPRRRPTGCRNMGLELGGEADRAGIAWGQQEGERAGVVAYPSGVLHRPPLTTQAPAGPAQIPPHLRLGFLLCPQCPGHRLEAPTRPHVLKGIMCPPLRVWCFAQDLACSWHGQKFSVDISEGQRDLPKVIAGPLACAFIPPANFHSPRCHQNGDTILLLPTPNQFR